MGDELIDSACIDCRGEYRVVYITPEFIEADGCELLRQLHSRVGTLVIKDRLSTIPLLHFYCFLHLCLEQVLFSVFLMIHCDKMLYVW